MSNKKPLIILTGGAGYIGSQLTASLLDRGFSVHIIDTLLYGGDSLLAFMHHPDFSFSRSNILDGNLQFPSHTDVHAVIHLAAIAGFPACQIIGRDIACRYNIDGTEALLRWSKANGHPRFIFTSTYSAYGSENDAEMISETSPQNPQTLYAETKIRAEEAIRAGADNRISTTILRLCDVFGLSPRTRFDLLGNQFIWNAIQKREITVFQRSYLRCLIHISDVIAGILAVLSAPLERMTGKTYILGNPDNHHTKEDLARIIMDLIPGIRIVHKDITFGGYRRNFQIDPDRMLHDLGFRPAVSTRDGLDEVRSALNLGLIRDPASDFHHNARFPVI